MLPLEVVINLAEFKGYVLLVYKKWLDKQPETTDAQAAKIPPRIFYRPPKPVAMTARVI